MNKEKWEIKKLGEVVDILNGFAFKSNLYTDEGIRVLRITNVQKGKIIDDAPKFYPFKEEGNLLNYLLRENDLLISLTGNVGRVGILKNNFLPAALNQRVGCLRLKNSKINLQFLFHFLNSDFFEKTCINSANGIAQKNLSTEWLKQYEIPIPPLPVQQKIVSELDTLHRLKELQEQQLAELDNLAQSTFYTLFGDPIENEKGWEVKKLGEVCEINPRKSEINELNKNIIVSFVPMANVGEKGELFLNENKKIEEVWSGFTYFRDNDILFAKITPCMENGKGTIANNLTNGIGFGSTEFHVLRPKKGITSRFVFQILSLSDFRKIAEKKMTGSAGQKRVPKQFLENFNISVPPLSLQTQFAIRIEKIEGQKELIKQGVAETQQLIDYTMDKYFG